MPGGQPSKQPAHRFFAATLPPITLATPVAGRACTRRSLLRAALALGTASALSACGRRPSQPQGNRVPAGATVVALGDSLTYGTGATPETAYPAVLARLSRWQVINAGVPGDTSAEALARLPGLLRQHQPQLVIVSIGGNDFLRRLPEADTRTRIESICRQAQASGAQVLLVAIPRPSMAAALGSLSDHPMYEDIAKSLRLPLQRGGWSAVLGDAALRADRIHANAQGYAQFAQALWDTARAAKLGG